MKELKPCPFCGAKADIYSKDRLIRICCQSEDETVHEFETVWVADCSECNCVVGETFKTKEQAIATWNRRV